MPIPRPTLIVDIAAVILLTMVTTAALQLYLTIRPERYFSDATPADYGLAYENLRLGSADGIDLAAWLVPSKRPSNAAIIVLHGYPADKGDLLPRLAFLAEDFNLLFIDFRYFGQSAGAISTAGAREVEDLLAGAAELERRGFRSIGVYGFSMGGAVALMGLDRAETIRAAVADSAYANLTLVAEESFRPLGPFKKPLTGIISVMTRLALGIDISAVSPAAAAARSAKPVLLIHSRRDQVVPFHHAELLQKALKDNPAAEFYFTEVAAHGEQPPEFEARLGDFFRRHLNPSAKRP